MANSKRSNVKGKQIGRAELSFREIDGILDVVEILESDPWNQIDDFVQHVFVQNVLDEFNERVTRDPEHTPADNKRPGKKRAASSSRATRKSQPDRMREEKLTEGKKSDEQADSGAASMIRGTKIVEGNNGAEEDTARSRNGGKKRGIDSERKGKNEWTTTLKENAGKKKASAIKTNVAGEPSNERKRGTNIPKTRGKKQSSLTSKEENEEKAVHGDGNRAILVKREMEEPEVRRNCAVPKAFQRSSSGSPLGTSTPTRELARTRDFPEKKDVVSTDSVAVIKKERPSMVVVSRKKDRRSRMSRTRELNNNRVERDPSRANNASGKREKSGAAGKVKGEKKAKNRGEEATDCGVICERTVTIPRKEQDVKTATTAKKPIGKFEERLLDRRERRSAREIRRHERKAERAMEKFSHHVVRIVKKMGYLPDSGSSSSSEDDDTRSDYSDEWSYSDESSYSYDSCCSNSSCSCCTSDSWYFSEYSPYSSSD